MMKEKETYFWRSEREREKKLGYRLSSHRRARENLRSGRMFIRKGCGLRKNKGIKRKASNLTLYDYV